MHNEGPSTETIDSALLLKNHPENVTYLSVACLLVLLKRLRDVGEDAHVEFVSNCVWNKNCQHLKDLRTSCCLCSGSGSLFRFTKSTDAGTLLSYERNWYCLWHKLQWTHRFASLQPLPLFRGEPDVIIIDTRNTECYGRLVDATSADFIVPVIAWRD